MKLTVFGNNATCPEADGACSCYLLQTKGKRILLDMGNGSAAKLQKHLPLTQLDAIIISHLHFDHVGNLPLFSNAEILLNKIEWESANQTPDEWHSIQTLAYLEKRGNLHFVKEKDMIAEDVSVMELPGHTPGLIGLRCGAESILCSDAMKNRYELWKNIPLMSQNLEQSRRSIQRIKENARYIYPGHDGMLDLLHENSDEYPAVTLRYADGRKIDIKA